MDQAIGLDFGTTNTVLAEAGPDGIAYPIKFHFGDQTISALRSALSFWRASGRTTNNTLIEAGPDAIRLFIDHPGECRFIQSFKTFAASHHFAGTIIHGRRYKFEDLLEAFFARIRSYGASQLATLPKRLVVGRPVNFAGAQPDAS